MWTLSFKPFRYVFEASDGFKTFPQLLQLDLSFNQIKNIKLNVNDYETLEVKFPTKTIFSSSDSLL